MTDDEADSVVILKKIRAARNAAAQKAPNDLEDRVALEFAGKHVDDFRYIAKLGRWMCWDGSRWRHEDTLRAFDEARVLCRQAQDAKAKTVAAVVTLARADRAIAAIEEQWDIGDAIFNVPTEE
jgi:putative DNA primase/helicase